MTDYAVNCHFRVEWGGVRASFLEVSGLDIQLDVVEERDGSSPVNAARKMPGQARYSNIVLKRGIVKGDNDFYRWMSTARLNTIERRDVTISLLDETHQPLMTWKARNAFPAKLTGPQLNANGTDVAIETLELAHEGLEVETS